jgi:CheY-like chemotaxis protein
MNKKFENLKCLIIEDATDHIESARNALIDMGIDRRNIFPDEAEQIQFTGLLTKNNAYEKLLTFSKDNNIDFILLDMAWKKDEIPPNTSGENFLKYLEQQNFNKIPIIGYSKFEQNDIKQFSLPLFYIKKESINVAPSIIKEAFKKDIRMDALVRICNANHNIAGLKNTIQEQKVVITTFMEYISSSDVDIDVLKGELVREELYDTLPSDAKDLLNSLVDKIDDKSAIVSTKNALFSFIATNPQSSIVMTKIMQSILG